MQIERKPSRWPYVGGLVCLLIFCLTVPRYWQPAGESTALADTDAAAVAFRPPKLPFSDSPERLRDFHGWSVAPLRLPSQRLVAEDGSSARVIPGATLPGAVDPHAIDELLVVLRVRREAGIEDAVMPPLRAPARPTLTWSPPAIEFVTWQDAAESEEFLFAPLCDPSAERVAAAVCGMAQIVAEHGPCNPAQWLPRTAQAVRLLTSLAASEPAPIGAASQSAQGRLGSPSPDAQADQANSPVLLIDPGDRLAMRPIDTRPPEEYEAQPVTPRQPVAAGGNPWCTPEVLFAQLERLTRQPHSARWADQTLRMLHAVTIQDRSQPELVATLLRRLSGAAEEAARLADDVEDDRLRADLLRAHWALARRIDTWAVMHEIRIAAVSRTRIATRGSLHSLFDAPSLPADTHLDLRALSAEIESYEGTRDPAVARQIANMRQTLQASPDELDRSLAGAVEQHYRNANVRLAVSAEMINRFAAQKQSEFAPVRDCIVGTPVYGKSHTLSRSRVALAPATGRWQMELAADGNVAADTVADAGHVQLFNEGDTEFLASKPIIVAPGGVHTGPSSASAYNRNRVVDVTTDFDWVPLLGAVARNMAMQQYRQRRPQAKLEVEYRVASQVMERLDRETVSQINRLERDLRERFLTPLDEAGIVLTTIEMTSTHEHVVGRFRLAGEHQLAGHTPRPRALPDSLANLQVHESALTNAAVALRLDGGRFTAPELEATLRERFPRLVLEDAVEPPDDTIFHFAPQDAVQLRIAEGTLRLSLVFVELVQEGRPVRNFIAHAVYVPVIDGLRLELIREGPLGFEGPIGAADRARLHSIFREVLPEDRPLPLIRQEDVEDERFEGLTITQLVLEDGWLGLAVGHAAPGRPIERSQPRQ